MTKGEKEEAIFRRGMKKKKIKRKKKEIFFLFQYLVQAMSFSTEGKHY